MPARPRKETIRQDEIGCYHCFNRCVRRAFLCGVDPMTGNDYGHRKTWIQQRLETLAAGFAVEVCGFSAMDNHLLVHEAALPAHRAQGKSRGSGFGKVLRVEIWGRPAPG